MNYGFFFNDELFALFESAFSFSVNVAHDKHLEPAPPHIPRSKPTTPASCLGRLPLNPGQLSDTVNNIINI